MLLLVGLGVTELSVSPAVIPEIKAVVRRVSLAEWSVAQAAFAAGIGRGDLGACEDGVALAGCLR